jgi:hypothetical protein
MPHKNSDTERFGGPGSSRQDRKHPEKGGREHERPERPPTTANHTSREAVVSAINITRTMIVRGAEQCVGQVRA